MRNLSFRWKKENNRRGNIILNNYPDNKSDYHNLNIKSNNKSDNKINNKSDFNNRNVKSNNMFLLSLSLIFILFIFVTILSSNTLLVHAQAKESFGGLIDSGSIFDNTNKIHKIISGKETQFNVDITLKDYNVQTSQVAFSITNLGKDYNFESCTSVGIGTTSKCHLSIPTKDIGNGEFDYLIIYNPNNLPQNSESGSFVVDSAPPTITNLNIVPKEGKLEATFNVIDYAQGNTFCAGVRKIEASLEQNFGSILGSKDYPPDDLGNFVPSNNDLSNCILNGEKFMFNSPSTGTHTIHIRAIDRVNNKPVISTSLQVIVDASKPELDDSLGKYDFFVNGIKQNAFSPGPKSYDVKVYLIEKDGIGPATLDVSALGQGTKTGSCLRNGNTDKFTCTWTNINIDVQSGSINIPFKVSDTSGNELSSTISKTTNLDSEGPSISNIKFLGGNGEYIGESNNTLIATIKDTGIGVSNQTILTDLTAFGKGQTKPDECKNDICYWRNLNPNSDLSGKVNIKITASDLFGNINSETKQFTIDFNKPVIGTIIQNVKFPYAGMKQNLIFTVNVSDIIGLDKIIADFSQMSSLSDPVDGSCSGDKCTVTLQSDKILSKHKTADVTFTVYDNAGNSVSDIREVEVVLSRDGGVTNLYRVIVGDEFVPKVIDRRIASQTPVEVMLPLTFEQIDRNGNARIAKKSVASGECNVLPIDGVVTDTPRIIGQYGDQSYLVFPIKLDKVSVKLLNHLEVNCTVSLLVIEGDTLYTSPQTTQLLVDGELPKIYLYNNPLGDPGEAVINKLKNIRSTVKSWGGEKVRTIDKFLNSMREVCDVMKGIDQFYTAVEAMKSPIFAAAQALRPFGLGDGLWGTYLTIECTTRVTKETFWPSASEFNYDGWRGVLGGEKKGGLQGFDIGGYARTACNIVYCTQCGQGFGFSKDLANANLSAFGIGEFQGLNSLGGAGLPEDPSVPEGERGRLLDKSAQAQFDKDGNKIKAPNLDYLGEVNLEANVDPYKNWVTALGCGCAPAIVSHAERYQQIQCMRARCISDRAVNGLPIDVCEQEFAFNECVYFKGGYLGNFLFAVGIPWLQTMVEKVAGFIAEPGRLLVAGFDKALGCDKWKSATDIAMRGSGDTTDIRSTAKKIGECFSEATNREPLDNYPGHLQAVLCGGLDVVVTADSFQYIKDNALEPFTKDKEKKIDYCDGAFDLLEQYEAEQSKRGSTSKPASGDVDTGSTPSGAEDLPS